MADIPDLDYKQNLINCSSAEDWLVPRLSWKFIHLNISLRHAGKQKGLNVINAPFAPLPSFIWTLCSGVILLFHSCISASCINQPGDTCLIASDSFVRYHCAIWCSRCTGKVFLCGALRQSPSLWNCISNILFRLWQDTSLHLTAASSGASKWSKRPQWHPAFFPLLFCCKSLLSNSLAWAGLRGAEGVEADWQSSLEYLKWTYNFWVDLRYSDELDLFEFTHIFTFQTGQPL